MSILFKRLLTQAEAKLADGDHAAAEATCCQVLIGGATLDNIPLSHQAAQLLRRIPPTDAAQRRLAVFHLSNQIAAMQRGTDREGALLLCEELLPLSSDMPDIHLHALDMTLYITGAFGMQRGRHPAHRKYLEKLLEYEKARPAQGLGELIPVELSAADGPLRAYQVLANRGTAVVRALFDPEKLEPFRAAAGAFFERDPAQAANIRTFGDPADFIDGAPLTFLKAAMHSFFMFDAELSLTNCFIRRVEPRFRESAVPFHQDVNAFGRLMINVWTPLVPCGRDAPGIEVVARRTPVLMETVPATSQYDELQISEELVRERFGEDATIRPEMQPGDVLILLGTTIHRTHVTPQMTERRLSMELRFAVQ